MAEEAGLGDAAPPPPPPHKPIRLLRYILLVLIVVLLQAAGAYFLLDRYWMRPDGTDWRTTVGAERPRVIPETDQPDASVDMGEFVANPKSAGSRMLVTTEVTLAIAPKNVRGEILKENKNDQVKDAIIYELSQATPEELGSRDGRDLVKTRMKRRINEVLYEGQVVDIFFGKFIMQALPGYRSEQR